MIILGIDPGFSVTGFSILAAYPKTVLHDAGYLKLPVKEDLPSRINIFYQTLQEKIIKHQVTHLALETPFLGKNTQSFLKLGYLRGTLYLLAAQHNLLIQEFTPREVKMAVTGFGAATKDQVAAMIERLFPSIKTCNALAKQDVTDAIAIGLSGIWGIRSTASNIQSL